MAARRLIVALIVLLAVSTILAVVAPRPEIDDDEGASQERRERAGEAREAADGAGGPSASGGHVVRTIDVEPGTRGPTVRIALGEQLTLTVRSSATDQLELVGLGIIRDVDPEAPARFDILPYEEGRHPLRMLEAEQDVAEIVVVRRR